MTSFLELLAATISLKPAANAVEHEKRWWRWCDLDQLQQSIGYHFEEAGTLPGNRIGILLRNRPTSIAALLACALGRRCAVAFNPLLPADRLRDDIGQSGIAMLLGEDEDIARQEVREVAGDLKLPLVRYRNDSGAAASWVDNRHQSPAESLEWQRPDLLMEILTSGTTGAPKRISLSIAVFEASLNGANAYERKRQDKTKPTLRSGVRIVTAPLTHISGISAALMSLAGGRKICLMEKFEINAVVDAIKRHKVKVFNAPPTALRMLLDADIPREDMASLVALRSGTAPLDPKIIDEFLERYDVPILGQYGATEFAGSVAGWTIDQFRSFYPEKRGSVGCFQPNVEGRIVDPEMGEPEAVGSPGVLELRGPQVGPNNEWVRTTDRAKIDSDGFLFILGRADHAIIRGGFKIHPDEIIAALQHHPKVREAAVVGIADRRLGEVPAALATLQPGESEPPQDELKAFLKERLLPYQIPVRIEFTSELPRTPMLKPKLAEIRRILEEKVISE